MKWYLLLQKKTELNLAKQSFRAWTVALRLVQKRKLLVHASLNHWLLLPQLSLAFRIWKVKAIYTPSLMLKSFRNQAFSRWRKTYMVQKYYKFFLKSKSLAKWKFLLQRKTVVVSVEKKKKVLLHHLLSRKFMKHFLRMKSSFQFWKALTLASFYRTAAENEKQRIDRKTGLDASLVVELSQRRRHSILLQEIRSGQAGRILLFNNLPLNHEENFDAEVENNNEEIAVADNYRFLCDQELIKCTQNKSKYRNLFYLKRNDPIAVQTSVLNNENISLRKKLHYFMVSQENSNQLVGKFSDEMR
jgi:hypothetical protein